LTSGAEIVGRYTRHGDRFSVVTKFEEVGVSPDVSAVTRDIDRKISEDLDPTFFCGSAKALPLVEEEKLQKLVVGDSLFMLASGLCKGLWGAVPQAIRPLPPRRWFQAGTQGRKEGPILKPGELFWRLAESAEGLPLVPASAILEMFPGALE
jgi:hypothetical protein